MTPSHRTLPHAFADSLLVGVFLLVLLLPLLDQILGIDPTKPLNENRTLAPSLEFAWSFSTLRAFPDTFEAYYNDHFGFRNFLVRKFYRWKVDWLGVSPARTSEFLPAGGQNTPRKAVPPYPQVLVGKEGWLFLGSEQNAIEDYRGARRFTPQELETWTNVLDKRREWSDRMDMRYLFFVAPNKSSIYPEFVPSRIRKVRDTTGLDQFFQYVNLRSRAQVVDVRPVLRDVKKERRVYEVTGTHWNEIGAYYAYREVMTRLGQTYPKLRPHFLTDFEIVTRHESRDLARMLGMGDIRLETVLDLKPKFTANARLVKPRIIPARDNSKPSFTFETGDSSLPSAIFFHDSFGETMKEMLAEHFSRMVMYRQVNFTPEIIAAEKPDIILQEMVERTLTDYRRPANFPEVERLMIPSP